VRFTFDGNSSPIPCALVFLVSFDNKNSLIVDTILLANLSKMFVPFPAIFHQRVADVLRGFQKVLLHRTFDCPTCFSVDAVIDPVGVEEENVSWIYEGDLDDIRRFRTVSEFQRQISAAVRMILRDLYPYIDPGKGGTITGNIAACDKILSLADNYTKIVAGHGPLGNKADLTKFRDMLITSRDRVEKLKSTGKSAQEAGAEKPFADLDPVWGKGIINSEQWIQIVYLTL
jgi:hypothetical protein